MATSNTGFTINDILETDYNTLFEVFSLGDEEVDPEDEVIPIDEFMRLHPEI